MVDLFEAARANAGAVEAGFEAAVSGVADEHADVVREFAHWVEAEALVSINTRLYVILDLINGSQYKNTYEWAEEQARLSGRPVEEVLREQLARFYSQRAAFDKEFVGSNQFRYGALNAGGVGLNSIFSRYCLVLKREFQMSLERIACWLGDSLVVYFEPNGSFNLARFKAQVAPHSHRHQLVATERRDDAVITDRANWPKLVLHENRYFEVVFIGDVRLDAIESVRIPEDEYLARWDESFFSLGKNRSDAERALINDFIQLQRAQLAGRVRLEVIP